jgi:hypothetical protein
MKRSASFILLTLVAFAGCRSIRTAKSLDTLREVKIERGTILTLGGKMPPTTDFCNWSGAVCTLKPNTFGGTESMSLSETETGQISQFHFYYGLMSIDMVDAQINDYTRLIGKPPRDSKVKIGEIDVHRVKWTDSTTTFELTYKSDQQQIEGSATLSDNSLTKPID